jgi:hypothetical protein
MRLANDFTWSFSRRNTYQECQKKYWYTYYGSWEGWPKTPYDKRPSIDPLAAYLYAMKQMQSIPTFVGTVVHNTVEQFLKKVQVNKERFTEEALIAHGVNLFSLGIEEAKTDKWKKAPKKHTNLFEYYYGAGLSDETIEKAKEKVTLALTNWNRSQIVRDLLFHPATSLLTIEALEFFQLDNQYKIIVVIDLALLWKGRTENYILFDWKTGSETAKTEQQLYCYALFANKVWKVPLERIVLAPFYLVSNTYYKIGAGCERPIDPAVLIETEKQIVESCKELVVLHQNQAPENFPYTEERGKCQSCPFKQLCEKADYKNLAKAELRELAITF